MIRLSSSVCPFCEARALFQPWHQARSATTTLQKRKPSRMTLSPRVRRETPPTTTTTGNGRPVARRSRNSPFGGMNVTEAPRLLQSAQRNTISAAEQKRASKHFKATVDKGEAKEPMRALKMQRALSSIPYETRARVKQDLGKYETFDDFALLPVIKESVAGQALGGRAHSFPTPIQRLAVPALLGMSDGRRRKDRSEGPGKKALQQFLLAAETGSGKTLAYVLPVVDALKRAEVVEKAQERADAETREQIEREREKMRIFEVDAPQVDDSPIIAGRPRAIILVPTSELAAQVGVLIKSLSHTVKFRAAVISAAFTSTVIRSRLFAPAGVDIVVSTPHLLSSITESDPNVLSQVSHLVIDEADSLFDRSFAPITSSIIDRATPSLRQLILCSATIPRSLDSYMHKRFPDIARLVTPNLHAIPRRVQLSVVDIEKVPYQGNRDLACAQTIWDIGKESAEADGEEEREEKKIVVFVNGREKAVELAVYLRSRGIDATGLSRDSDERKQKETLTSFTDGMPRITSKAQPPSDPFAAISASEFEGEGGVPFLPANATNTTNIPRRQLPNTRVLVMTDLGSRGIDTLPVKHVVLYDVPHTSIDFIHRLGRVGRMGRRGRGVVLVGKNDRKDVVKEVREGMFKGQALI